MDDSEPDLYGGMGGQRDDDYYTPTVRDNHLVRGEKKYTQTQVNQLIQKHFEAIDKSRMEILQAYHDGYMDGQSNKAYRW
jgi:hypothetical protein